MSIIGGNSAIQTYDSGFNQNQELIQMLDKINRKARDLTAELLAQGILNDEQMDDIKNIRLSGHKLMKRRIQKLSNNDDQI